ncbi:MAG: hypothetical protein KA735_01370 [Burkholderiaceae bacterium]|nr:hypothetical protein [Burkholderiaceae bacterium]
MIRLLYSFTVGLLALATQGLAIRVFFQPTGAIDPILVFFAWQVLAALMMALFTSSVLLRRYRGPHSGIFIHVFAVCLFLPVAGQILFLSIILVAMAFPSVNKLADSTLVQNPKFVTYLVSRVTHGGGARLRARLANSDGSTEDRMAAMVAVQSLPTHITDGMLRKLLTDPYEEIRLLAYGVVDSAEKAIMKRIFLAQEKLTDAVTSAEKNEVNSRLAELYWELIYQHLVEGEVHSYTLERVEHYAHEALEHRTKNAAMWYLLGRCALLRNKPDQAEEFFRNAQYHSFPADRLLPWLAEVAFLQRDFGRIGKMLIPLSNSTTSPLLQPSVRYWSAK